MATRPRSSPRFSSSSMTTRCSRASEPWWALTSSPPPLRQRGPRSSASSFRRVASRSARRRALQKMIVERCGQHQLEEAGVDRRPDAACGPGRRRPGRWPAPATTWPRAPMSSTGTTTSISSGLRMPASTMVTGRGRPGASKPPRKRAISSSGRCVADSPMRCGGRSHMAVEPLEGERRGGRPAWWGRARGSRR